MNDSDSEMEAFEAQLRQIQPARPSDELMARLEGRDVPVRIAMDLRAIFRFILLGFGMATALIAVLIWFVASSGTLHLSVAKGGAQPSIAVPPAPLVCSSATEAAIAARDEGIYTVANGQPVRVIRLLDLNKSVWKDPSSGDRLEVVFPRQELLVKNVETY